MGNQFAPLAAIDLVLQQMACQRARLDGEAAGFADDNAIFLVVLEEICRTLWCGRRLAVRSHDGMLYSDVVDDA